MGGLSMAYIFCCNQKHLARVFDISSLNSHRKTLIFLDECSVCGQSVAVIKEFDKNMNCKRVYRRCGVQAINQLNKFSSQISNNFKIAYGSKENMSWKYQKNGRVYDFNNTSYGKIIQ